MATNISIRRLFRSGKIPTHSGEKVFSEDERSAISANCCRSSCFYCDVVFDEKNPFSVDHIIPRASVTENGNSPLNLIKACALCNNVRGDADFFVFSEFAEKHIIPHRNDLNEMWNSIEPYHKYYQTIGMKPKTIVNILSQT